MAKSILELIREREREKFDLHERYLNAQHVRVLKTIGFDRHYVRASGAYLYDDKGDQYLDLLSGFGVFAVGRNHPTLVAALREVLEGELSGLVQMDVSRARGDPRRAAARDRARRARQGVLRQLGRRGGRVGDQVRALSHRPARSRSTAITASTGSRWARCR